MVSTLVAGVLVLAAPAAQAQRPFGIQQFEPNDTQFASGGNCAAPNPGTPQGCINDYLSDKFDGVDSLAHLTAVATPETTQVTWYACPLGTAVTVEFLGPLLLAVEHPDLERDSARFAPTLG